MSFSTQPGPTLGNWLISPTRIRRVPGVTAFKSACIRKISTMDISSMMITSASSGFSSFRSKEACATIFRRRAGQLQKPVDGHCLIAGGLRHPLGRTARWAPPEGSPYPPSQNNRMMELMVVVLPVPGPPVRIRSPFFTDSTTARRCMLIQLHLSPAVPICLQFLQDLLFLYPAGQIQVMEHLWPCSVPYSNTGCKRPVVWSILFLQDQLPVHTEIHHLYFNIFLCHTQKLRCPVKQHLSAADRYVLPQPPVKAHTKVRFGSGNPNPHESRSAPRSHLAILNPTPEMSSARRYGFSCTT